VTKGTNRAKSTSRVNPGRHQQKCVIFAGADDRRGRGRPTSFKTKFVAQAERLAARGLTDSEIADFFEVTVRTLQRWKHDHPDFCRSLKTGKDEADTRVERALYQRAVGFEHDSVKIFLPAGAEGPVYARFREYIPPDPTSCIFWLKNRRPKSWRDRVEHTNLNELFDRMTPAELEEYARSGTLPEWFEVRRDGAHPIERHAKREEAEHDSHVKKRRTCT
jgi:hypothetical protein